MDKSVVAVLRNKHYFEKLSFYFIPRQTNVSIRKKLYVDILHKNQNTLFLLMVSVIHMKGVIPSSK